VNWAPTLTVAPVASEPFQAAFRTLTCCPVCDQVPFQPLVSRWSPV